MGSGSGGDGKRIIPLVESLKSGDTVLQVFVSWQFRPPRVRRPVHISRGNRGLRLPDRRVYKVVHQSGLTSQRSRLRRERSEEEGGRVPKFVDLDPREGKVSVFVFVLKTDDQTPAASVICCRYLRLDEEKRDGQRWNKPKMATGFH